MIIPPRKVRHIVILHVFISPESLINRGEKTFLRDFRPGPTQTGLYGHRRWLEAFDTKGIAKLCSENKSTDQLRGYLAADLRSVLLFSHNTKIRFAQDAVKLTV